MKAILLATVLVVSQAAAMDNRQLMVTVDPNKLSLSALKAVFDALSSCQAENEYQNRRISLEIRVLGTPAATVNTGASLLIRQWAKDFPNGDQIVENIRKENAAKLAKAKL